MKKLFFISLLIGGIISKASDKDAKIHEAIEKENPATLRALLKQGGNVNGEYGSYTHLQWAIRNANYIQLSQDLEKHTGQKYIDFHIDEVPLEHLPKERLQCLRVILDANPDINATSRRGDTALSTAIEAGIWRNRAIWCTPQPARFLLRRGAYLSDKNINELAENAVQCERVISLAMAQKRLQDQDGSGLNEMSFKTKLSSFNKFCDEAYWTKLEPFVQEDITKLYEDKAVQLSSTASFPTSPSCTIS